jgi:endonuclease/exonuclease/phosphatase family metal-dependent hydrolase
MSDTLRRDPGVRRSMPTVADETPAVVTEACAEPLEPALPDPRRWRGRLALMLVCCGLFVYYGQQRHPIGPSAGPTSTSAASGLPGWGAVDSAFNSATIRLGTYNIHGGKGTDGKRDLGRIADMLRGVDFAGLNEVCGPALYETADQAAELGRLLKLEHHFAPTEERWWHLKFGNGYLSKLPIEHWQVVPLERKHGKSFRNYVHVKARVENQFTLNLLVAHIDRSDDRERREQLRTVANAFLSLAEPAVLLGDLNSDASEDEIVRLVGAPGVVDAIGKKYGLKAPRHIDWIFVRGCRVQDAGITGAGPSDHPHVWADVELGESTDVHPPSPEFKLSRELEQLTKSNEPNDKNQTKKD